MATNKSTEPRTYCDESLPAADTLYAMLQEYPQARARTSLENIQDTLSLLAKWNERKALSDAADEIEHLRRQTARGREALCRAEGRSDGTG